MKKLSLILTMVITGFYQTVAQGTIVDVAVGNKDFFYSSCCSKAADLVTALQGEGPFTVFQ
jgi:uncharacterized surface protein with fasciclin (FAS1) repeats